MTWKGELPTSPNEKPLSESIALKLSKVTTYVFFFYTMCSVAFTASMLYSLHGLSFCTSEELFQIFWREFEYGPMWPLLGAGIAFLTWRS